MCGIIGYIGNRGGARVVFNGLKNLEYRGYDSCGIAVLDNHKFTVKKEIGRLTDVEKQWNIDKIKGSIAIGHTRWATTGSVTKKNAHPHLSNNGKIAVVHNGIIENFSELKKFLLEKGFVFKSETDSEVIPNLIEIYMRDGISFVDAVKKTLAKLEGSYAVIILNSDEQKIIGARKESPLVVGVGDKEYFIASDIPAFIEHTKNVIYLDDYDLVVLNEKMEIFNIRKNKKVEHKVDTIAWDIEQARKGNFDHYMLKEITEQAEVINRALEQDKEIIDSIADAIRKAKGVYFVACGTAYHACVQGMYLFSKIAARHVNVALASEFPNYVHFLTSESLVIAVSQSGETADTLAAIRAAKSKGAKVISIVNVMGSTLARESDQALMQHAGPEICVLSTKSYTSQLVILTLLAYALADKFEEGKSRLKELIRYIYYLTSANMREHLKKLAEKLKNAEHIYLIGRNTEYPTALEAALKIKEVSYIHAEGFAGGELKHGSIALIEKGTPCIVFTSTEDEKQIISNAAELKARGAYIIGVGPKNDETFDFFIKVREAEEANSIVQIIPIQMLAYQLALLRGCNPDFPRNLAKSVTVK
jgi:glucosamine--fructose-6-phosphate aminotransferase (isomerizing)